MPTTEHDNDRNGALIDHLNERGEHAHYIGTELKLDHGPSIVHVYAYRGDWYAVHTH